jgi:drug/metabolite transporter (DMT)-like permease
VRRTHTTEAFALGSLAVLLFSFTLPATREAVPVFGSAIAGLGRSLIGALLAGAILLLKREPWPARRYWGRLALVSSGVAVGFPLFISLALHHVTSAHSAVIVGILPATTAILSVVRAGERPSLGFWLAAGFGLIAVVGFAAVQGAGRPQPADALVLIAVLLGALGYAEGGALSREIGGWRVISWALVLALPILIPVVGWSMLHSAIHPTAGAWLGFGYVALISSYLGFFPWYRALALGGVARISQIQLAQPVLTLIWSAILLGEHIDAGTIVAAFLVLASVAVSQRMRVRRAGPSARVPDDVRAMHEERAAAG